MECPYLVHFSEKNTHILTFQELHKLQVASFMCKEDKSLMPPYFSKGALARGMWGRGGQLPTLEKINQIMV